jgi:hypothetical protein
MFNTIDSVSCHSLQAPSLLKDEKVLRDQLAEVALATLKKIAEDHQQRMQGYSKDVKLLEKGMFYPNDYYKALKQMKQEKRLQWMIEKGHLFHGLASSEFFDPILNPSLATGRELSAFQLKKGKSPSDALEALQTRLTLIGCGEVCQVAYYKAFQHVLGKEKFDAIFAASSSTPLQIGFKNTKDSWGLLVKEEISMIPNTKKGQIVHIPNIPTYKIKHINGEAAGFNLLCCEDIKTGQEKFLGFGIPPTGMSTGEISNLLLQEYNATPIGMAMVTQEVAKKILENSHPLFSAQQYQKIISQYENHKIDLPMFKSQLGGLLHTIADFNTDRIMQLAKSNIDEATKLFKSWKTDSKPM